MSLQSVFKRARWRRGGRLLILSYERVEADPVSPTASQRSGTCIDLGEFRWQMEQIAARFKPVGLSRLRSHLGGKSPLVGPQICVSFQSESQVNLHTAFPVLRQLNLPATLFAAFEWVRDKGGADTAGARQCLDWSAMRELAAEGLDIAYRVDTGSDLLALSPAQRRQQLSALRCRAEQETGVRVQAYAYPGDGRSDADKSLIYDAAIAGFNLGLGGGTGINSLLPIAPMTLKRTPVTRDLSRAHFQSLLEGLRRRA
jgi:peptidoglycan/xylan/chitin deacetylase (PgdA/CDA1 family)